MTETSNSTRFSFFRRPVKNTVPHSNATLRQVYNAIRGEYYKQNTLRLRTLTDARQRREFKASQFDYACFGGVFSKRAADALLMPSNLMCFDFDNLGQGVDRLKQQLIDDPLLTTALLFRSPSGNGLKWITIVDLQQATYDRYFEHISRYLLAMYGVEPDKACRDICRACFLPYDPEAYIHPQFCKTSF